MRNLFLTSTLSDIACLRIVRAHSIAGAVGRSESALAFTTSTIRLNLDLWDDGYRTTPPSAGGGTSGITNFDQRSPIQTLGAFVPTNSPFFRTVP
jgi:hypothetical protein